LYDSPAHAIASRFDLPEMGIEKNLGAIDSKITSYHMALKREISAISGPTHDRFPPFDWRQAKGNDPRDGLPDRYDFQWQDMTP